MAADMELGAGTTDMGGMGHGTLSVGTTKVQSKEDRSPSHTYLLNYLLPFLPPQPLNGPPGLDFSILSILIPTKNNNNKISTQLVLNLNSSSISFSFRFSSLFLSPPTIV